MNHEAISKVASTATYTGSTVTVGSAVAGTASGAGSMLGAQDVILGLTLNQWTVLGILFGMAMALVGVLVNVYFKHQYNKIVLANHLAAFPDGD